MTLYNRHRYFLFSPLPLFISYPLSIGVLS